MNRDSEDKLTNAIIALHQEIKGLRTDMDSQLAKVNLAIGELRLSYMNMDATLKKYTQSNDNMLKAHEKRIVRLEDKTFGNSFVSEPMMEYKKRKKRE
ncbi:MAG: hypothetical protein EPN85_11825 [Bacteroidetes bacterium]|nr:MAG: hypothetical protein EPN85_11825 [Bacteroidota bacterium]